MTNYIILYEESRGEYNFTTFLRHECEENELRDFIKKEGIMHQFTDTHAWDAEIYEVKDITDKIIVGEEQ